MELNTVERNANDLLDALVDRGPMSSAELCAALGWSKGRFAGALKHAREVLCPSMEMSIPMPTPATGWRYQVTTDWAPVEAGAAFTVSQVESRLKGVLRDVRAVRPHLTPRSKEWRRANFLEKHLGHILGTLEEIDNG